MREAIASFAIVRLLSVPRAGKGLVTKRYSGAVSRKKTAKPGMALEFQLPGLAHEVVTIAVVRLF